MMLEKYELVGLIFALILMLKLYGENCLSNYGDNGSGSSSSARRILESNTILCSPHSIAALYLGYFSAAVNSAGVSIGP